MIDIALTAGPLAQPGCDCTLGVLLRNEGGLPVVLDNPAALLALPQWRVARWPDGAFVLADNAQHFEAPPGQPAKLELAPGATWQGSVRLRLPQENSAPGEFKVMLTLDTPEGEVVSAPCRVRVGDWALTHGGVGYGAAPGLKAAGEALFIQAGEAQGMLYRMPWADNHSDRTGHGGVTPVPLTPVANGACDPLVPLRDAPFTADPARWMLWREGAQIHARNAFGQRVALQMALPPVAVLRPALQRNGEAIEVCVLAAAGRRLDVLQFPRTADGVPVVAAQFDLPQVAANGATAFAPQRGFVAALAGNGPSGAVLMLLRQGVVQQALVGNLVLEELVPPALQVLADGAVLVAALVRNADGLSIAKVRFEGTGAGSVGVELFPAGPPHIIVRGGVLLLLPADNDHAQGHAPAELPSILAAALWTGDGSIMTLDESGALVTGVLQAQLVWPGAMVAGHAPLLLACDPLLGPYMAEA